MCQCFNNFLQASWPLALVLLHRTKKRTLLIWSQICVMLLSFMGMSRPCGHLGKDSEKRKSRTLPFFFLMECHYILTSTTIAWWQNRPPVTLFTSARSHWHCTWVHVSAPASVCIWYAGANRPIRCSSSGCVEKRTLTVATGCWPWPSAVERSPLACQM